MSQEWDGKERRIKPDERYRFGWCCDHDFEEGTYRTTDCIGPTRNADVVERLTATSLRSACIDKVKELAEQWRQEASKAGRVFSDKTAVATKIAAVLESVSIQEQETKADEKANKS